MFAYGQPYRRRAKRPTEGNSLEKEKDEANWKEDGIVQTASEELRGAGRNGAVRKLLQFPQAP